MSIKIGKARSGSKGGFTPKKYYKLQTGDQVYRILPPLGDLADEGRWSVFHSVHYGYKNSEGKQKPFLSPEVKNRKDNTITVRDAAKERIDSLKAKLEEAKDAGNDAVVEALSNLVGQNGMYNLDNNHYMNVMDLQGNIGILKLRHKAKLALEKEIKDLNAQGVDPLGVEDGRYFVFSRSGMGRDTTFAVKVYKEKVTLNEESAKSLGLKAGSTVERDVVHALDNETIHRLSSEAGELDKIFKHVTSEEVEKIVKSSNLQTGVSPYMDTLFGKSGGDADAPSTESKTPTASSVIMNGTTASGHLNNPVATTPVATAPAQAVPAAKATPIAVGKASPITPKIGNTAKKIAEMSQEEFIASLKNGTL